ncbi:13478_t:CDS:2 [Acaulospora colombiana]|uniref:13478_t:CDS:1 n=1 Tax=Acaulospora colombiana TaxID=27376 RepID=A0ACA9KLF7_9GLOM|nr:13478_t:CDS:2 [Acaulospora colombiana]
MSSRSQTLHAPTRITVKDPKSLKNFTLEYSIHSGSRRFNRDLASIFPEIADQVNKCLVIPVFLNCENDMVGTGSIIDKERDEKLENFVGWGKSICQGLRDRGYWADLTDPCSGYPIFSDRGPSIYPDVQGAESLLKYPTQNVGCCHILLHPRWGSKVYPGTLFTFASVIDVKQVIDGSAVDSDEKANECS